MTPSFHKSRHTVHENIFITQHSKTEGMLLLTESQIRLKLFHTLKAISHCKDSSYFKISAGRPPLYPKSKD